MPGTGDNAIFNVKVVATYTAFRELKKEWDTLLPIEAATDLPLTWAWFDAWLQGFWKRVLKADSRARLNIIVISDIRGVAAIAPLYITDSQIWGPTIKVCKALTNGFSPYWDLVLRPDLNPDVVNAICTRILASVPTMLFHLTNLRAESALRAHLVRSRSFDTGVCEARRIPIIDCAGHMDEYLGRLSRKYRKGLRRKLNVFWAAGDTRVARYRLRSSSDPLFSQLVAVSRRSWKGSCAQDLSRHHDHRQSLVAIVDHLGPLNRVDVWIAYKGNDAIASELHLRAGNVTYPIQADYSETASALSPGSIVEHHALRAAFDDTTITTYDTCAANYWYLARLATSYREVCEIKAFSKNPIARVLYFTEFYIKPLLRRLRSALGHKHDD